MTLLKLFLANKTKIKNTMNAINSWMNSEYEVIFP
jgi:hypothetical protein